MTRLVRIAALPFVLLFSTILAHGQTCTTGQIDERITPWLKALGPAQKLEQIRATPVEKLKQDGPKNFRRLPDDSVKRIQVTADKIRVNVIRATTARNVPVIINFHQGGFMLPLLPWMEYEAMRLSKKFNAVVFDVDYRVAPEHKFPTAVNDAYNVYLWVLEHAEEYGGDPGRIILNGTSAGANLAALVMHRAKKQDKLEPIRLVMMMCPPTDNPMISFHASYEDNAEGYWLTKDQSLFYFQSYLEKTEWFRNNPEMWPIYEKDLSGMPPTLIITTEFDVLRDEGIAYGKKLEQAGNKVAIKCFPHQLHCFAGLPPDAGEIQRVYELMGEAIANAAGK